MTVIAPTTVTFFQNSLNEKSKILGAIDWDGKVLIICEQSPFHPVDHIWPDQPADKGEIVINDHCYTLEDCIVVTQSQDDEHFEFGSEITAKRFDEGWNYLVGHLISTDITADHLIGKAAELKVDENYRNALNLGHSACHLSALALNQAMELYWKREVTEDSLGHPDFDKMAISDSKVTEFKSRDEYRIGKSLKRKQGFKAAEALEQLENVQALINQTLESWVATGESITMIADGNKLNDTKRWQCRLNDKQAEIFCGGSHAVSLKDYQAITVKLQLSDDQGTLTMCTTATPA
ncbi:hypothetical protein A3715_11960 [Oleiphilus sp. HI0009]|uniref:hypothetical protein n=2 Tax=Oleiphilus TaxID=141450 RepID=UPI0007C3114A|nr:MULTISPECIES: hypothetical protein [unclassified Oleiphilus]KZX71462.1 hypothetical protein A3715_26380 [Oleiphilus sp. HI0009]KZX77005.1 hypothetical protein A3715_11960 [Oleiphilus sp. HI0009]KZY67409.1 hypothetical protein A3739_12750 [Oleiphilus sp. HI0067]KZY69508.1 hypothetical protein A3738_04720 [Oleiphilus sp. HI0066]